MKITELLKKDTIILDLKATSKAEVIDELVDKLDSAGRLNNKEDYKKAILKRESEFSTGIGDGIAIPHAKTAAVKTPALAFGRSISGIDYDSLDGNPANIFFMIAASEGANSTHLETLSRLSTMLMNPDFKAKLLEAKSEDEILRLVDNEEEEKMSEEESENSVVEETEVKETEDSKGLVLAVTACPTGIAHTYMAADALKNKAKEMGVNIKVETNGSTGVKNKLTEDEINRASGIIVAADKKVEMARFDGKKVIQVPVVQGIKRPEELITQALNGDAPIYKHEGGSDSSDSAKGEKSGFYKHLMSGVSNMLPFVVGGGILIAISFMFGIKAYDPKDPSYNYIAKLLNDIGGANAFALMVPVLAGFIGMSIADRPGFAPAMVGGLIAANNGAGFIGGLIAGFLGGYIVVLLKKVFDKLPQAFDGIKPVLIYPLLGILITGAIMFIVVIGPVNAFNLWLQHVLSSMGTANKVILGVILGGMMCIDMGGPINKAAFTFGIAMISSGNYYPHAAIMAGGMVPPLGIALATTFFKNRFNAQERNSGLTCYIMGLCFITEGAIPFAAADPARVIPASVVGAAITGGLTMLFNIGLPAPHGGIFVFGIVKGNPLLYLLAVAIGAVVTCLLLAILKKPIKENEVQA
ncbi:PTS system fructose-specific EIIABC component [Clostridium pasteurianum DSM 525 = ATCC 6013]|uniref:PTS system fructose-specific EIIABC component n=1 Tax=Clostridium pasteurianum DSM 525 = ATCC 6013 TaxID=1262449 RepID=A0A0H3J7Y6_CLOPA|nr:PTS fructose transporter subunit IIABC [Clostridium pasteurianum]AJA50021.1 PTS system fructose-specific EIIABC component [Clostridium pasteurianum DSM 525 = ATCC 6013]AJA54009.1 PTS system fructose-specific EIIABC component [Clostridium pasteurianum DSM 525 = ATCC 6013]AOZ77152.1 PTS fructose transporter subunit IIA [Clostridium pasteurianum DSM 525 = ATCC 6013]AOZ80949.1 PTS fructose transporter subunit IIA [Clostridium pasteurianum]ELP59269.1 PTS system fructose-specific transporter subu